MESLAIYQKVNSDEKLRMGLTLGYTLLERPVNNEILAPAQIPQLPATHSPVAIPQQHPEPQLAIEYPVQAKSQKIAYETEDPLQNAPAIQDENSTVTDETYDSSDQDLMELIGNSADSTEMMTQYNQQVVTSEGTVTKQVLQKKTSPRPPHIQYLLLQWKHYD